MPSTEHEYKRDITLTGRMVGEIDGIESGQH